MVRMLCYDMLGYVLLRVWYAMHACMLDVYVLVRRLV